MIDGRTRLFALVVVLVFAAQACCQPPDQDLVDQFYEHRQGLDELVRMADQDPHLLRVGKDFTRISRKAREEGGDGWPGLSEERWERYRELFAEVGASGGFARRDRSLYFFIDGCGLGVSGRAEGFVHSESSPGPVFDTLDELRKEGFGLLPLEDNWYLFAET